MVFQEGFDSKFPEQTQSDLYVANIDGTDKVQLTNSKANDFNAEFSPNGRRVAFSRWDGKDYEIHTISATGGNRIQLTNNDVSDVGVSYSPEGSRIAFSRWDGSDWELYTMSASGGNVVRVTNNLRSDYEPSYSPNGFRMAYTGEPTDHAEGDSEIFTIKTDGTSNVQVTADDTWGMQPSWGSRR
jgi:Tol biopolymer transport system component